MRILHVLHETSCFGFSESYSACQVVGLLDWHLALLFSLLLLYQVLVITCLLSSKVLLRHQIRRQS